MEAQPLGFVTARSSQQASMVLLGVARDAQKAPELTRRGADAVLIDQDGVRDVAALGETPAGGWVSGSVTAASLRESGYDFAVFDPDRTPSIAVLDEEIGYVLSLPGDLSDAELRAVEGFQLDAIDVGKLDAALSVRKQIALRRVYALTHKPLMASVPKDITVEQLQALRDTNVVIVCGDGDDAVERLRKTIDALPERKRRRDGEREMAVIPRAAPGHDEEHDDEDE